MNVPKWLHRFKAQPESVPQEPANLAHSVFVDLSNELKMEFVLIPAGSFMMGSPLDEIGRSIEESLHEVEITKAFYMGKYPVTQKQYETIMANNPSWFSQTGGGQSKVNGFDTSHFPVDMVSWFDAQDFAKKLSRLDSLGRKFGLPSP